MRTGSGRAEERQRSAKKSHKSCRRDQGYSFHTRHHLCGQGVALAGTQQLCSEGAVSVHAHCTEGIAGSEGREGANGIRGGIKGGVGGRDGDVNVDRNGDGAGRRTGVEANEGRERGGRRRGEEVQKPTHGL